jgi:hypothetical protein
MMIGEQSREAGGIAEHVVVALVVTPSRSIFVRTNTAICLTKRAGEGMENSVMIAQSSQAPPWLGASRRATPHSRSQMSIARTPPGWSASAA